MTFLTNNRTLFGTMASLMVMAPPILSAQSAGQSLDENTYIRIAEDVLPSIVNLTVEESAADDDPVEDRYRDLLDMFGQQQDPSQRFRAPQPFGQSSGSGVVIREENGYGYILTNNHVIDSVSDTRHLTVTFHLLDDTETEYNRKVEVGGDDVRVIGYDELSDLAVVEFKTPEGMDLKPVSFADSDSVKLGEIVVALGNPLELTSTVTQGIISGKSRYLSASISLEKLLQTDAVIQPGNSGGPLVNLDGKIIGINNAIASRNGMWQGTSFAIPSNDAERISGELIEYGRVMRGFLGIEMTNARSRPDVVQVYKAEDRTGVLVTNVVDNTPAQSAGLKLYDLVRKIDDTPIEDSDHMLRVIANKPVNSTINLEVIRLDEEEKPFNFRTSAVLTERPNQEILRELSPRRSMNPLQGEDVQSIEAYEMPGLSLSTIKLRSGIMNALVIDEVETGSNAEKAGLKVGDIITKINGTELDTSAKVEEVLTNLDSSKDITLTVEREQSTLEVILKPE